MQEENLRLCSVSGGGGVEGEELRSRELELLIRVLTGFNPIEGPAPG